MPIYEYRCVKCGNVFELLESINSDHRHKKCVKCGHEANRIMSQTSFHLKGGGWYTTDYKKGSSSSSNSIKSCKAKETTSDACKSCEHSSESNTVANTSDKS